MLHIYQQLFNSPIHHGKNVNRFVEEMMLTTSR